MWCGGLSWIPVLLRRIMLVGLRLSCSWCVVTLKACGGPIRICGSATGEMVFLLALSGCEVASEAPEEPIHSPIAYLDWIWRGSTSTLSIATMPVWFSLYRVLLSVSSHPCHFILAPVIYFRV